MYNFYNSGYDGDPNFNWSSIETALKNGFNGIMLTVPWDQIYPTRNGLGNWAILDKQVARIIELGGKVGLVVALQRDLDRVDTFWPSEGFARTHKNEVLYRSHAFQFSPAHQPTVDLATDFVRQVAQRYNGQQQQGNILFISVVNSPILEQEYSATSMILYQAGETSTVLDYSTSMITGFRNWLMSKYSTISALNATWGRGYVSFNEVQPPGLYDNDIYTAFAGKAGKDWYAYRHKVHKALVDQTTQAIKSVNSTYKVINQHGSVFDSQSPFRGTLGFKNYALSVDGVKVNDAPEFLHGFSMDLVRSNLSSDKWVMNEVDGQTGTKTDMSVYLDQATQSFAHGAKVVTFANFADAAGLANAVQIVQRIRAQGWLDQPVPAFAPSGTISVKLSQLIDAGGYSSIGIPYQWLQIYNQNGNLPVRITIDEDILDATAPTSTTITPPVATTTAPPVSVTTTPPVSITTTPPVAVTTTPPGSTTTALGAFTLVAPTIDCATGLMTFKTAGGDGTPTDYLIIGYTDWSPVTTVTLSAEQRSGMTFTLAARQSGHEVKYTFTTNCSGTAPAPVNQPPVLVTPLASQTTSIGQSYSFVIPAITFNDPDGQLVSWAVSGLPAGLTYTAATRTISGASTGIGTAVVTVLVTDNGGATAQTTFTIKTLATAPPTPPAPAIPLALSVVAPSFDCITGKLIFRSTGGDGSPVEYFATGIKPWGTDTVGYIAPWQRDGVTFTLQARQSGKLISSPFKTSCLTNKAPVVVTPIASQTATLARSYSYVIPAATFSDPDGQLVSWVASNLPVGLTFDTATHTISGTPSLIGPNVVIITVTDNGGASVQTTFILQVLGNNAPPTVPATPSVLAVMAPSFDCTTGKLIFRSTGGDGSPVEYFAVGIKVWSRDSVGYVVPWQRDGVTFSLQARQSGKQASLSFKTSCSTNQAPVVVTPIASQTASLARSYSFVIPAATFSDPDGQLVSWAASNLPVGLTFDAGTHTISGTPSLIGPNVVTITVTDNGGASVQTTFILQVLGNNAPPTTPATSSALTLIDPSFDCATDKLIFRSTGGDGSQVEYFATGIKSWSTDSVGYIAPWQRDGVTFTLQARQSGKLVTYTFKATCTTAPVSTTTTPSPIPTISTLVVVSPQNRIVYQRNQNNQANVSVIGQAPGIATRAEARLVPVVAGQGALLDWTDLPLSVSKTFATLLKNTGGWYRLEVRAWNGNTQLGQQAIDRVGIGEVFVVAGQSNAYGGFEVRPGAQDDRVSCLDYKDDNLYEASLPVQFSHMDISVSAGPNNPKHIWPELGDKLTSRLNVPVLFLGAAQSSTTSEQWRQSVDGSGIPFPDNFPYRRLGATILHYIARTGARAVLWHQGEGDQNRTSAQDYVNNLTVVINKSRSQSSNSVLPWVVSRTSYVYGVTDPVIISAQNRLTNEVPQVYPGPYTDVLGAAYRPIDNVHLSGPGATSFVDMWDQSLSNDFFSRSTPFSVNSSPQITTGYTLTGTHLAGQTIKVPYVVSGNPDATSSFSVQLIRDSDGSVVTTVGSGQDNPMTVTLPGNLANGMYRAKVVAANLTALAGEPFLVGPVGGRVAAPETQAGSWQTWPNPAEHDLTIAMPTTVTATKLRIVLRTVSGQMPAGVIESTPVENGQVHLTLPTLQTGIYFLQIYDGEQPLQTLKIVRK